MPALNVPAGKALWLFTITAGIVTGVTDSAGNTFTEDMSFKQGNLGGIGTMQAFSVDGAAGSPTDAITVTLNGTFLVVAVAVVIDGSANPSAGNVGSLNNSTVSGIPISSTVTAGILDLLLGVVPIIVPSTDATIPTVSFPGSVGSSLLAASVSADNHVAVPSAPTTMGLAVYWSRAAGNGSNVVQGQASWVADSISAEYYVQAMDILAGAGILH